MSSEQQQQQQQEKNEEEQYKYPLVGKFTLSPTEREHIAIFKGTATVANTKKRFKTLKTRIQIPNGPLILSVNLVHVAILAKNLEYLDELLAATTTTTISNKKNNNSQEKNENELDEETIETVKELLNAPADKNRTISEFCARSGSLEVCRWFHEKMNNFDPLVENSVTIPPVYICVQAGSLDLLIWIRDTFSDNSSKNKNQNNNDNNNEEEKEEEQKQEEKNHRDPLAYVYEAENENLLHLACRKNHFEIVKYLVEDYGKIDIHAKAVDTSMSSSSTCFTLACAWSRNLEMVKFLYKHGGHQLPLAEAREYASRTSLSVSQFSNNSKRVKTVFSSSSSSSSSKQQNDEKIQDNEILSKIDEKNETLFLKMKGFCPILASEIAYFAPKQTINSSCCDGDDNNADSSNGGSSSSIYAAAYTVPKNKDRSRDCPLHRACASYDDPVDIVKFLIEEVGFLCDLNIPILGTCLYQSATYDNVEITKYLLSLPNIDVDKTDSNSCTPLYSASWNGNTTTAQLLLEKKANPNIKFNESTMLVAAITGGHTEIVRMLLQHGAEITTESGFQSPLETAQSLGHHDIAKTLMEYS